jgi:hypothetical protein
MLPMVLDSEQQRESRFDRECHTESRQIQRTTLAVTINNAVLTDAEVLAGDGGVEVDAVAFVEEVSHG